MNSPFPLVILIQSDPPTAGRIQQSVQPRFGGRGPSLNRRTDGKSYTIQVEDTATLELLTRALREHGATSSAYVSVNSGAGPQWVPLSRYM